uniref:Glutathione-disulfide reductase n=1 Tax=Haptolina brevifila TaxID=156173 RepID=A0A7S2FVU5_9EUKA|mmetsp:Transcript_20710/g.42095  ORF Transcript_20710/g.42095 Transcript_20710/m.42095 type:complete len:541 (+) Transcript_20710:23-1645(+)|eukprot:CAMPEP_0174737030 /NCGR_PEP_ID=MMETSP1094-20130205/67679_1 /TAXON_ID=156173 /ORGANISM="Chrysochromulina brevifilum, Strain UTEX LB 985" /LENGTH=540 /DNA_ID=CAMNT_0015940207 /DNA_START=21 /DNA_END=1643 /DNA_ORIENTATION=-
MPSIAEYDFIVIGGGSGGSACARRAAEYGARVVIIDKGPTRDADGKRTGAGFGGTCVNVGCVPKKIMFFASSQREAMVGNVATAPSFGFNVPESAGDVDWTALKERRDKYVADLNGKYAVNWTKAKIDIVTGEAKFESANTVHVVTSNGEERLLRAPKVLIAVGGMPAMPSIPGIDLAISSDGFFDLEQRPQKVAVVGAGYIAVEMAGILHGLGSDAHLFFRGETVMRHGFDPFVVEALMGELKAHGPSLHPGSSPARLFRATDGKITLVVTDERGVAHEHAGFDCVLMAIGRKPNTAPLKLDKAGLSVSKSGHIDVDEYEATSVAGIYSIGDVTSTGYELTPVAIAAGRRLSDRLFGAEPKARIEYATIATVVFSHPPIGTIGLTEPQARKEFGDDAISTKTARFASMGYAFNAQGHKVMTGLKLVLCGPEERVVGLHCIGPSSDEMLQGFAVAVRMGATRHDFEASVAIHPTIAEEFVTFGGWGQKKVVNADGMKEMRPTLPPFLQTKPKPVNPLAVFVGGAAVGILIGALISKGRSK